MVDFTYTFTFSLAAVHLTGGLVHSAGESTLSAGAVDVLDSVESQVDPQVTASHSESLSSSANAPDSQQQYLHHHLGSDTLAAGLCPLSSVYTVV